MNLDDSCAESVVNDFRSKLWNGIESSFDSSSYFIKGIWRYEAEAEDFWIENIGALERWKLI